MQLMRPYLHEFLTACYPHFNIIIWYSSARAVALRRVLCHGCAPCSGMSRSATTMRWIEAKLDGMGVSSSPHFKISMHFDATAMITGMSALNAVSMNDRCANMGCTTSDHTQVRVVQYQAPRRPVGPVPGAVHTREHYHVRRPRYTCSLCADALARLTSRCSVHAWLQGATSS